MSTFTLDISSPLPAGYTGPLGGPGDGGHHGPWFNASGNDLGAPAGTLVHAAFDGVVSKVDTTGVGATQGKVYGVGLFVRASGPGLDPASGSGVGGFYTHFELAPGLVVAGGAPITRGQLLGHIVAVAGISSHIHFALGVRTNEVYSGANIYTGLQELSNTSEVRSFTLSDSGGAGSSQGTVVPPEEHEPLVIDEGR